MKNKKLPITASRILAALVKMGDGQRIVEASKSKIQEHVAVSEPYHPLQTLIKSGYIRKVSEGKNGANVYKILKIEA